MNEFDDFLNSLEERRYKPIMCHKPSDIIFAENFFEGYITKDELSERQYVGRFWTVCVSRCEDDFIYIILDNETVLEVSYNHITGDYKEILLSRVGLLLPDELQGCYYND